MEYYKTIINNTGLTIKVGAIIRPLSGKTDSDYNTTWTGELAPGTREVLRLDRPGEGMPFLNGLDFRSSQDNVGSVRWHVTVKGQGFDTTINTNHTLIIRGRSLENMEVEGTNPS